jgi:hypothetical protein
LYADPEPGLRLGLGCAEGAEDETEHENDNRKEAHEAGGSGIKNWNGLVETPTPASSKGTGGLVTPNVGV